MMVIDLDGFKAVNDKHGHLAGDALLIEVARRFNRVVAGLRGKTGWPGPSPRITLARVGGDEFVMLLDMLTDRRLPEFLANRLLVALREPMPIDGELVAVGASIGIAHGGGDYTSIEQIRRDADLAMYEAKGARRDRIVTFTDALGSDVRRRMALERELREAIRENQFLLFYQPIFCLGDTPYLLGFEALIRWAHPTRGTLSPDAFIPAAEASGLIVFIGDWVMRQACTALVQQHAVGKTRHRVVPCLVQQRRPGALTFHHARQLRAGLGHGQQDVVLVHQRAARKELHHGYQFFADQHGKGAGRLQAGFKRQIAARKPPVLHHLVDPVRMPVAQHPPGQVFPVLQDLAPRSGA